MTNKEMKEQKTNKLINKRTRKQIIKTEFSIKIIKNARLKYYNF